MKRVIWLVSSLAVATLLVARRGTRTNRREPPLVRAALHHLPRKSLRPEERS